MTLPRFHQKNIRKIMLIFPPSRAAKEGLKFCCMPLGISYLASSLRQSYDVTVLDTYARINIPHHILSRVNNNTSMFTSRGCPARCTF